jgi:multidrug transporter EmrE-like cation transporter
VVLLLLAACLPACLCLLNNAPSHIRLHSHLHPCTPAPLLLLLLLLLQVIGATSSLTYNVVGHVKTVLILSGGVMFFGDTMPPKKMAGIACAMGGIIW